MSAAVSTRSRPARTYVVRRLHQRHLGYRLSGLALWHDEGNRACHHCTYITGTTIRDNTSRDREDA